MTEVIVDTSAWIESFRPEGKSNLKGVVKQLISEGKILLPGIVKAELLRGTKSEREYEMLDELLSGLIYLPVEDDFWGRLARFCFNLFRDGITVPLTDAYIALLAIEQDASLLHHDAHFNLIANKAKLKVLEID